MSAFHDHASPAATGNNPLASSLPVFTLDQIVTQLTDGYWTSQGGFRAAFNAAPGDTLTVNLTALTTDGQQLARWALEAWTDVSGLNFLEVALGGQITFDDEADGAFANSVTSGSFITSSTVNISKTNWLPVYGTTVDSYSFQTYLHEIGHALGLGHAGNYNGNAVYGTDNHYLNDSWQATVMSYFDQAENTYIAASKAFTLTLMPADIVAIQTLYGSSVSNNTGNTTYGANSNVSGYLGDIFGQITGEDAANPALDAGNTKSLTIFDTGGLDTLDFSVSSQNNRLNLQPEAASDTLGLTGNLLIARGTIIENVLGGTGNDTVIGNSANNALVGGPGNDTLYGGEQDDTLLGEAGNDVLSGDNGNDSLRGGTFEDWLFGGAGADWLFGDEGFDNIFGGLDNDTLYGGEQEDTLNGEEGNDVLSGENGNDSLRGGSFEDWLFGGAGADWLFGDEGFDNIFGGLDNDTLYGGEQEDTLNGEEGNDVLSGENGNDSLRGGSFEDWLFGGAGNDALYGDEGFDNLFGGLGNDTLVGGEQQDTLNGEEGNDVLSGENGDDSLQGGSGTDWLFGGAGNDTLLGGSGDDNLFGSFGNDLLTGGTGNDTISGEQGSDIFVFADSHGLDVITGFEAANGAEDIDLSAVSAITDFLDLRDNHMIQQGADVLIDTGGGNSITLIGTNLGDLLDGADFLF